MNFSIRDWHEQVSESQSWFSTWIIIIQKISGSINRYNSSEQSITSDGWGLEISVFSLSNLPVWRNDYISLYFLYRYFHYILDELNRIQGSTNKQKLKLDFQKACVHSVMHSFSYPLQAHPPQTWIRTLGCICLFRL